MVLGVDIDAEVHDDMYGNMCGDNIYIYFLEWFYEDLNDNVYDGVYEICSS